MEEERLDDGGVGTKTPRLHARALDGDDALRLGPLRLIDRVAFMARVAVSSPEEGSDSVGG